MAIIGYRWSLVQKIWVMHTRKVRIYMYEYTCIYLSTKINPHWFLELYSQTRLQHQQTNHTDWIGDCFAASSADQLTPHGSPRQRCCATSDCMPFGNQLTAWCLSLPLLCTIYIYILKGILYTTCILKGIYYILPPATTNSKSIHLSRGSSSISGFKKVKGHVMMFSPGVTCAPQTLICSQNDLYSAPAKEFSDVLPKQSLNVGRCGEMWGGWSTFDSPVVLGRVYCFTSIGTCDLQGLYRWFGFLPWLLSANTIFETEIKSDIIPKNKHKEWHFAKQGHHCPVALETWCLSYWLTNLPQRLLDVQPFAATTNQPNEESRPLSVAWFSSGSCQGFPWWVSTNGRLTMIKHPYSKVYITK